MSAKQYVVLRRYVPGRDATVRGFETRAELYGNGDVGVWSEYTDERGGTLAHFSFDKQELRRFLAFATKTLPRRPRHSKGERP